MKIQIPYTLLFLTTTFPLGACADADGASQETTGVEESTSAGDLFAGCRRDALEDDYYVVDMMGVPGPARWYGPGADADGKLIDDGDAQYIVSATYLALRENVDQELFGQLSIGNSMALFSNPGLVAVQLGGSMQCGSARTFAVWESQEAVMAFVTSEAHSQSIGAFSQLSRGGSTLSIWDDAAAASEITLSNAMSKMADETPYD